MQPNSDEESEPESSVPNGVDMEHIVNHETTFRDDVDTRVDVEHIDEQNLGTPFSSDIETNRDVEHTDEQIMDNLSLPASTNALVLSFTNKPVVNLDAIVLFGAAIFYPPFYYRYFNLICLLNFYRMMVK